MKVISVLFLVLSLSLAIGAGIASATDSGRTGQTAVVQNSIVQPLALPDSSSLVFVPLTPCRILDTRNAGGKIAAGSTRNFYAWGVSEIASQGGNAAGCGVPSNASAIAVTLTGTAEDGNGNLRAWPYSAPMPTASVLNYKFATDIANSMVLPICISCTYEFSIYANVSGTHLVGDVAGYFIKRVPTVLSVEDAPGAFASNTALCETTDYTPVVASKALVDGQLSAYSASPVQYGIFLMYSTDGGTNWGYVTDWFSWATASSTWGSNAISGTLDLTAGTTYRFAIQSDTNLTGDSRCHLRANIVER